MKIFFGLLMFAIVSRQFAYATPVDTDGDGDEDYINDKSDPDYNDDYDGEDKKTSENSDSSTSITEEPYVTQNYTERAEAGQTVVLKCLGKNFDSSTVFMWHNGSGLIFQGITKYSKDDRINVDSKDGSMVIKNVNSYDDVTFRCRAFTKERYETLISLEVNSPPRGITIGHNVNEQPDVSGLTLTYPVSETDLRFKCNLESARPKAKFEWIHNGNSILESQGKDHDIRIEDESTLIIKKLHARHAGEYQCEAFNDLGNLKSSFRINVEYKPFFTHHRHYFNAEEKNDVELHCLYKSFPAPKSIKWLKGGSRIHENDKYIISNDMREHHDRAKLLIKNVNKNDLVLYQCEVENDLGVASENVTVGVGPAPAKFEGYKYINNIVYTDWVIKSFQTLNEMQILYRNNQNGWRPKSAVLTRLDKVEGTNDWKVQGTIELDAGEWLIMARAKNSEGWSDDRFAQEISIKIPKDSIESQTMTGSATVVGNTLCSLLVMLALQRFLA